MKAHDWSTYSEHHTRQQVQKLLELGHYLPATANPRQAFPGWTILFPGGWKAAWYRFLRVWTAAGILLPLEAGGVGPARCDPTVKAVHHDRDGSWVVEWLDGRVTAGQTKDVD